MDPGTHPQLWRRPKFSYHFWGVCWWSERIPLGTDQFEDKALFCKFLRVMCPQSFCCQINFSFSLCWRNHQLLSPLSKGLFHRAIAESGTAAMDILIAGDSVQMTQVDQQSVFFLFCNLSSMSTLRILYIYSLICSFFLIVLRCWQINLAVVWRAQRRLLIA